MKGKKITAIGEALIDWVCLDKTSDLYEANQFIKSPGGSPANISVALAKMNYPVQFIGGFSKDIFGDWLKEFLKSNGVDISNSSTIPESNTRCAYILTNKSGIRTLKDFSNFSCADSMLTFDQINTNFLSNSPIVYISSLMQANEKSRSLIDNMLSFTSNENVLVYDPNLRLCLWPNKETAIGMITDTFNKVDIVKLSEFELKLFSGIENLEEAAKIIFNDYKMKLLVITLGNKGAYYINSNDRGFIKPFKVESIEETGAGDAFLAGLLSSLFDLFQQEYPKNINFSDVISNMSISVIRNILQRANAMGAIATTKPGATSALPTKEELEDFLTANV